MTWPSSSLFTTIVHLHLLQSQYAPRLAGYETLSMHRDIQCFGLTATSRAYRRSIPRLTLSFRLSEASHSSLRLACSASSTSQLIVRLSESMMILSPSSTSAIGPPNLASGTTWPIINPLDAPLNRPSVMSAVEFASPAPAIVPVGPWINGKKIVMVSALSVRYLASLAFLELPWVFGARW